MSIADWDLFFLNMAREISTRSKDPSTKVGAVIVDKDRRIVSMGYNGFEKGGDDDAALYADRSYKLANILHGEINAILFADSNKLAGSMLYTYPFSPCSNCSTVICQVKIGRVVTLVPSEDSLTRWKQSFEWARKKFDRHGIEYLEYQELPHKEDSRRMVRGLNNPYIIDECYDETPDHVLEKLAKYFPIDLSPTPEQKVRSDSFNYPG